MKQRIRLAVVMDPIEDIKYAKDTTLAMLLTAQRRGFELLYLDAARPVPARRRGAGPGAAAARCMPIP